MLLYLSFSPFPPFCSSPHPHNHLPLHLKTNMSSLKSQARRGGVSSAGPYDVRHEDDKLRTVFVRSSSNIDNKDNNNIIIPAAQVSHYRRHATNHGSSRERWSLKYMFMVLLAMFSCVPTTIFLGCIISWTVVILVRKKAYYGRMCYFVELSISRKNAKHKKYSLTSYCLTSASAP